MWLNTESGEAVLDVPNDEQRQRNEYEQDQVGKAWAAWSPSDVYVPHSIIQHRDVSEPSCLPVGSPSGQLQFHEGTQRVRIAAPGNGWGGTMAMACEVDAWCRHLNRWQETPDRPVVCIWFCPKFQQYELIRRQLFGPKCFGGIPRFRDSKLLGPHYEWPDTSILCLGSYNTDWAQYQGIEPDLVAFDEQPPKQLWDEMMQRSRGKEPCRFICKATQTLGRSWMDMEVYQPWLRHHMDLGLDELEAMDQQLHPEYWVWPMGGIHDNTSMPDSSVEWYLRKKWPSRKERKIRMFGGFEDFLGDSVFEDEDMDWLKKMRLQLDSEYGAEREGVLQLVGEVVEQGPFGEHWIG